MWPTKGSSGFGLLRRRRREVRTVDMFNMGFHDPCWIKKNEKIRFKRIYLKESMRKKRLKC
jgi:hypothetical protein